ncbi:putative kinase-like protein TMKL1 [Chenopodium quinoa]|uniref:Protein kinase domain-containing protein n=1 Tax=Chenopodium quinoa TaxID=63459 RepID=A0A803LME1_CHEQI|nr:putative kinase-like protein TMKL1 [Chenopodium quinoa]
MKHTQILKFLFLIIPLSIIIIFILFICLFKRKNPENQKEGGESDNDPELGNIINSISNDEQLMCFEGGEDLAVSDILDAPGEVIGKSSYGTLYKADLFRKNNNCNSVLLLRFLRPACSGSIREVIPVVHAIGLVRHSNLVPLKAFYMGPRGEKLLVHPFYVHGNLAQFIKDSNNESYKWDVIYSIVLGLAKGVAYLHTGFHKPLLHGNLKSKNVLLGPDFQPCISDYSLYLVLNPTAGLEMLETSAAQGYKAPELMKMKDVSESTDIYSLGILLLELLTGREPISVNSSDSQEFFLPNVIRTAILDHRIKDMYHPNIVSNQTGKQRHRTEDRALKLVQLAMSCCSASPSLRPPANEVLRKIEEIGKEPALQHKRT